MVATGTFSLSGPVAARETGVGSVPFIDAPVVRFYDGNTNGDYGDTVDNVLYYTNDANHNVTALVDADTGDVVERYVYDPYGKVTFLTAAWAKVSGTGLSSPYDNQVLYCGYRFDPETGLYLARNRYHDFSLGRWISRDPSGYVDGMNLYEYVRGRPTVGVDSQGTSLTDYMLKRAGARIPKAYGLGAGALIAALSPSMLSLLPDSVARVLRGVHAGAMTVGMFFPDTCEVAVFSVATGMAKALREVRWSQPSDTKPYEFGVIAAAGIHIEAAYYTGSMEAGAESFEGTFHTLQVAFVIPVGGVVIPLGVSIYVGDVKPGDDGRWWGATVGTGAGLGLAVVDWDYKIMWAYDLDDGHGWVGDVLGYCVCLAVIQQLP